MCKNCSVSVRFSSVHIAAFPQASPTHSDNEVRLSDPNILGGSADLVFVVHVPEVREAAFLRRL